MPLINQTRQPATKIILNGRMLQAICMQLAANIERGRSPFMTGTSQRLHSPSDVMIHGEVRSPTPVLCAKLAFRQEAVWRTRRKGISTFGLMVHREPESPSFSPSAFPFGMICCGRC